MLRRHTFAHRAATDRIAALPRSADRLCLLAARRTARDRKFEAAAGPGQRLLTFLKQNVQMLRFSEEK